MWDFFHKQTEKDIHKKMTEHLNCVFDATQALVSAIDAWRKKDIKQLDQITGTISDAEDSADRISAEIWLDFAKGNLKSKLQSNIIAFVNQADEIADYVKRAVYNLLLLLEYEFPNKVYQTVEKATELLNSSTHKLVDALSVYRDNVDQTISLTTEIQTIEHEIDELYRELKQSYFDFPEFTSNYALLTIFDHAAQDIEKAANATEDAGDILHSIVIGNL